MTEFSVSAEGLPWKTAGVGKKGSTNVSKKDTLERDTYMQDQI